MGAALVIVEGILLVLAGSGVLAVGGTSVAVPPLVRRLWLVSGGALLLVFVCATLARAVVRFPDGLFHRPFGLMLTVWFVATGL